MNVVDISTQQFFVHFGVNGIECCKFAMVYLIYLRTEKNCTFQCSEWKSGLFFSKKIRTLYYILFFFFFFFW